LANGPAERSTLAYFLVSIPIATVLKHHDRFGKIRETFEAVETAVPNPNQYAYHPGQIIT
jgi:hypothetical protein